MLSNPLTEIGNKITAPIDITITERPNGLCLSIKGLDNTKNNPKHIKFTKINMSPNTNIRSKIAKGGQKKYFKLFNEVNVAKYIVERSLEINNDYKPLWE